MYLRIDITVIARSLIVSVIDVLFVEVIVIVDCCVLRTTVWQSRIMDGMKRICSKMQATVNNGLQ